MSVLSENFDTIFGNKENIQALRNKVLDLAIRGKLVEQNPYDEPASALLERIKIKKSSLKMPFEIIEENEYPFTIPDNWEWTQLSNISEYIQRGKSPKYSEVKKYPVIAQKCVQWSGVSLEKALFITPESFEGYSEERLLVDGDILWNSTGTGSCGRVGLFKDSIRNGYEKIVADSHITVVRCLKDFISPEYLFIWLKSPVVQNVIESKASGSTNQIELATETIRKYLISVPPLAEQHRIVAKVDSLMSEIDKLEAALKKKERLMEMLPRAVVDAIGSCQTENELKLQLEFLIENNETIFQTPESMQELRNVILQLAIEGKLVPQDQNDEPASVLINEILEGLTSSNKSKRKRAFADSETNCPFSIPENWKWIRLGELVTKIGAGSTPTGGKNVYLNDGIMFIRSQNVYDDGLRLANVAFIDENINKKMSGSQVIGDDILLNITGASIGRCCIVPKEFQMANVNQHVTIIRLFDKRLNSYIHKVITSKYIQDLIMSVQVGVSREGLSAEKISNFLVPIPPLNEQNRIINQLNAFMTLIDQVEEKLKQRNKLVKNLAIAI